MAEAQAESCPNFPDVFFLTLLINKFPLTEMKELEDLETYVKDSEECSEKLTEFLHAKFDEEYGIWQNLIILSNEQAEEKTRAAQKMVPDFWKCVFSYNIKLGVNLKNTSKYRPALSKLKIYKIIKMFFFMYFQDATEKIFQRYTNELWLMKPIEPNPTRSIPRIVIHHLRPYMDAATNSNSGNTITPNSSESCLGDDVEDVPPLAVASLISKLPLKEMKALKEMETVLKNSGLCSKKLRRHLDVKFRDENTIWRNQKEITPESEERKSAALKLVCDLWNFVFSHDLKIQHELDIEVKPKVIPQQSPKKFPLDKLKIYKIIEKVFLKNFKDPDDKMFRYSTCNWIETERVDCAFGTQAKRGNFGK